MIWLEEFHISRYVRPYDARAESRVLRPPEYESLLVGDRVTVRPSGRLKFTANREHLGRSGEVVELGKVPHKHYGRRTTVLLSTGQTINYLEAAFKRLDKH